MDTIVSGERAVVVNVVKVVVGEGIVVGMLVRTVAERRSGYRYQRSEALDYLNIEAS